MRAPGFRRRGRHRARPAPRAWRSTAIAAVSSAALAGVVLAAVAVAPSLSAGVEQAAASRPITQKQSPPEPASRDYLTALARLDDRVAAVETAAVTLVGGPVAAVAPTPQALPRLRPDFVERVVRTSSVPTPVLTAEQLPTRVQDARREVAAGNLSAAGQVVRSVETDVLLVAIDLADQSAQNAALARLLVAADPHVAVLDASVGATHAAADARDVVVAATSATQARDAAAGLTLAAQQATTSADEATRALIARAEQQAHSTDGYANGAIPLEVLCPVAFAPGQYLRCDAAEALVRMNAAYRQAFGHDMVLTDSYRSLDGQVRTKSAKGGLAAVPGTSNHGWGLAIDLGDGVDSYSSAQYAWLRSNAVLFGWHHPTYMDEGGRGPHEPWHWEFGTTDDRGSGTSTPILVNGQPNGATPASAMPAATEEPTPAPDVPSPSPSSTPTAEPTPTPTPTPTPSPTAEPSPSGTPTPTPTPTPTDTPTPTPTDTPGPTAAPTP